MILSAVWTIILMVPINCRGSIGELMFFKFVLAKKLINLNSEGLRGIFSSNFPFWGKYSFRQREKVGKSTVHHMYLLSKGHEVV